MGDVFLRKLRFVAIAAALLVLPTSAAAQGGVLPAVKRTLSAGAAKERDCFDRVRRHARGVDTTSWRAPMSGFVTVRMNARRGDWDLALFDGRSKRYAASSNGFGSSEVAQTWVGSGERLLVQGCRRTGRARSARVSIEFVDVEPPKPTGVPQLLSVDYEDGADLHRLEQLGVDLTHHIHDGKADVIVESAEQAAALRAEGFSFETEIGNLAEHYARSRRADLRYSARVDGDSPLPSGRTTYRVYEDYQAELKALAEGHPDIVKPMTLPKKSFQGRELQGVEIASDVNAAADDGRPVYFVVALHHAREWPSAESAMEFAIMLAEGYGRDERITRLLRRSRVVIVPLINPDGFIASRGSPDPADTLRDEFGFQPNLDDPDGDPGNLPTDCFLTGEEDCSAPPSLLEAIAPPGGIFSYRRKNCDGAVPDGRFPCELQYGVDPNRNYGQGWGGSGSSGDPTSQTYRGPGPWSEPETQAVHQYSAARQVTNIITIHNVAALVLRPPGRASDGLAPDEPRMKEIGDAMGAATGYTSQYGFELYDTSGTTEDWNYAAQGAYGYTIEIGPRKGEFHMPYEVGFVDEWTGKTAGNGQGLREALMIAWEAAANDADHSVLTGRATPGRTLRLKKSFETFTSSYCEQEFKVPLLNYEHPLISQIPHCTANVDPQPIADGLETTMTVPESGRFEWHVNPSTRPFVGQDKVVKGGVELEPHQEETFDGPGEAGPPGEGETDHSFAIGPGENTKHLEVALEWPLVPEDYDLELFHKEGGELKPIGDGTGDDPGSSGNPPGLYELITVDNPPPGEYVLRVHNFAAVSNQWTATVSRFGAVPDEVIPGQNENWTLTCEDGSGNVLSTLEVFVERGQTANVALEGCGGTAGAPGAGDVGHSPAGGGRGKRSQLRAAYLRCVERAGELSTKKKRKAAKRRCLRRYRAARRRAAYRSCRREANELSARAERRAKRRCARRFGPRRGRR